MATAVLQSDLWRVGDALCVERAIVEGAGARGDICRKWNGRRVVWCETGGGVVVGGGVWVVCGGV